jgi:Phytanoyl-CoA dioxygenase (PhyH)
MLSELHRFWAQQTASARGEPKTDAARDWVADNTLLAGLRVGLRETYDYLLNAQPTFAEFEQWLLEKNGGAICAERLDRLRAALAGKGETANPDAEPALSAADLEFWNENGYVILHDAVPSENCQEAVRAICEFLNVRLDQPDTWYSGPQGHSIWIPLLHHPALRANRDSARIHRAFAQLWNREDVWVNVDQTGFNPPEKPGWKFPGPHLHWDVSLARPIPFGVQGILYLADVAADQGAFTCVPGFHRKIDSWLESLPEGADPRAQALPDAPVPIAGRAGDLVIWHQALPHGSSPNRAALPRIVQYLVGRPSQWEYNPVWR